MVDVHLGRGGLPDVCSLQRADMTAEMVNVLQGGMFLKSASPAEDVGPVEALDLLESMIPTLQYIPRWGRGKG